MSASTGSKQPPGPMSNPHKAKKEAKAPGKGMTPAHRGALGSTSSMSMHGSLRKAHPQDTTCTYDEEHEYKQYFKEQKNANTGAPWYSQQKIEEEQAKAESRTKAGKGACCSRAC